MTGETEFRVPIGDGYLTGHRGGSGPPALVLHGGPAISDYTEGLAAELMPFFSTIRYTQRGVAPSTGGLPYSVEAHAEDALAVLDHFEIERAWAVGHSWGGHLALHLAVTHPERLVGVIGVSALGAFGDVFEPMAEVMQRPLEPEQRARVDEIEQLRRAGKVTDEELQERWGLIWPQFFAHAEDVTEPPSRVGAESSALTNRSIAEHLERGTLERGLPGLSLPVLFVHGDVDPLPLSSVERTAALVQNARVHVIVDCGHFPWWERPGEIGLGVGEFLSRRPQ